MRQTLQSIIGLRWWCPVCTDLTRSCTACRNRAATLELKALAHEDNS